MQNTIAQNETGRTRDVDTMVIESLAADEAELRAQNAELVARNCDLEADISIYRDIAIAGFHALHAVTHERDRLRERNRELRASLAVASEEPTPITHPRTWRPSAGLRVQ